jgi:hypothetical protein
VSALVCLFVFLFYLALKIDDADSSLYAVAFVMNANEAAGHISIELSDHVLNNTFFLVCVSPIMQVAHAQDVTCIRRGVPLYGCHASRGTPPMREGFKV